MYLLSEEPIFVSYFPLGLYIDLIFDAIGEIKCCTKGLRVLVFGLKNVNDPE